jgi:hypothetical protein
MVLASLRLPSYAMYIATTVPNCQKKVKIKKNALFPKKTGGNPCGIVCYAFCAYCGARYGVAQSATGAQQSAPGTVAPYTTPTIFRRENLVEYSGLNSALHLLTYIRMHEAICTQADR